MKTFSFILFFVIIFSGCAKKQDVIYSKSALVRYFNNDDINLTSIPSLKLKYPLHIALGFVPQKEAFYKRAIEEKDKLNLLKQIKTKLEKYKFIKSVQIIPSPYIVENGGFSNIKNLRKIYQINTILLLSYDKIFFVNNDKEYLETISGYYQIVANKNDLSSLMEIMIIDINNKNLVEKKYIYQKINHQNKFQAEIKNFQTIKEKTLSKIDEIFLKLKIL